MSNNFDEILKNILDLPVFMISLGHLLLIGMLRIIRYKNTPWITNKYFRTILLWMAIFLLVVGIIIIGIFILLTRKVYQLDLGLAAIVLGISLFAPISEQDPDPI